MGFHIANSRAQRSARQSRKGPPPSHNFGPSQTVGGSMLKQAVCRDRLLPAGSLRCIPRNIPIPESQPDVYKMAALICHDLRLPLTAILANVEFLTQSDISETERNEFYQEIRWSIDRMNELVS